MMLRAFLARESHDAVVASIDWGMPKFRKQVCPEYKAQRHDVPKPPDEEERYRRYKKQMEVVHEVLCPLGIATARAKDWEGDDVLAALALHRLKEHRITVYSTDRDFVQLVDGKRIKMFDHNRDEWRDPDPFFCLKRCLDPKASDNLDGVPGIGPKKADRIVKEWEETLEERPSAGATVSTFIEWCATRPKDKVASAIVAEQQKVRANWKCTHLPTTAKECDAALKFRRFPPDAAAFKEVCATYNLAPLLEDFRSVWLPFSRLSVEF